MSSIKQIAANPRAVSTCRILGFCIFLAAFFLPACRFVPDSIRPAYMGWECAQIASSLAIAKETYRSVEFLAFMSGWINPFILLYLYCTIARRFRILRRVLAVAILICMAATWTFFAVERIAPLIGHVLWIAGALMILAPEAFAHDTNLAGKSDQQAPNL